MVRCQCSKVVIQLRRIDGAIAGVFTRLFGKVVGKRHGHKMHRANRECDWPRRLFGLLALDEMLHHALRFKIALTERADGFFVIWFAGEDIEIHGIVELREMSDD